ncbi:MAG: HhH-GDP family DNA glycosylase [Acidobacteriaceae bacterium]
MSYTLRFDPGKIAVLAARYISQNTDQAAEERIMTEIGPTARRNGFYSRAEFLELCHWKTPRTQPRCAENDELFVRDVTALALGTGNERLRIEALTLLCGVSWPTASVLLHFGHANPYPILDFRALWSLGKEPPSEYDFRFWWEYVQVCRDIADKHSIDMRTLDRALWQYSADNQPKAVSIC